MIFILALIVLASIVNLTLNSIAAGLHVQMINKLK